MKIICVCDEQGRILSICKPGDTSDQPSGITSTNVIPQQGQYVVRVDLPTDLENMSLLEIPSEYRIRVGGERAVLVKAKDFKEPFVE